MQAANLLAGGAAVDDLYPGGTAMEAISRDYDFRFIQVGELCRKRSAERQSLAKSP